MTPQPTPKCLSHLRPVTNRGIGLGGSDIAAIVGLSPYSTAFDVYNSIIDGRDMTPSNERQKWGRRLERIIAEAYAEEEHVEVVWLDRTFAHPEREWQLMTPDFVIPARNAGADSKNVAVDQAWKWGEPGTNEVPDEYAIQALWYIDGTSLSDWRLCPLIGGNKLVEYVISPDVETQGVLRDAAQQFLRDYVFSGKSPKPGGTGNTDSWLKKRFAKAATPMRKATPDEYELVMEYFAASQQEKEASAAKDAIKQQIQLAIGNAEGLLLPDGGKVTWRETERKGYTVAPTTYRALRTTKGKG
jgi:predicted phage-related endonuclease